MVFDGDLSSGKRLQFANWKITIFKFGKSTISMGHGFNSKLLKYQRVWQLDQMEFENEMPK